MSNSSKQGAICYEAESSWGEDVTTFATHRLPITAAVDVSGLVWNVEQSNRVEQYRQGGSPHVKMTKGGSFSIEMDWCGHGATTSGSPSVDAIETFKGIIFGNVGLSASASTTLTGGTAAVPTTTASGTFAAGSLCRVGTLGDGRGNGQFYKIATHTTTNLTLIGALDGAPSNGDVLYPVVQTYPSSAAASSTSITGTRFLLQTANLQYEAHGCWPMSVAKTGTGPGERPKIKVTFGVSWWRYSTATFPSAVTSNQYNPAPIAAGSLNVAAVGTTTRSKRPLARGLTIEYNLGVTPLKGFGGVNAYQDTVGAVRTGDEIKISWIEDADAATTTPVVPGFWETGTTTGFAGYHLEWTGSTTAGSAIGFACPKFVPCEGYPMQFDDGGINRVKIVGYAYTGATTTSALTLAAIVFGDA